MAGNTYNFRVSEEQRSYLIHDIDTSNTVDGKPVYYWINQHDQQIPEDAGFVGIIDSTNITVKDVTITHNGWGVLFFNTSNSRIENVTASNNEGGIHLAFSSNTTISGNTVSNITDNGIYLYSSSNSTISSNTVSNNTECGIVLKSSSNSTISGNTANNNIWGIILSTAAQNNIVDGNNASYNHFGIVEWDKSYNTYSNNRVLNNSDCGISLYDTHHDTVSNNVIASNTNYGIHLYNASNNTIENNTLNGPNQQYGIYINNSSSNLLFYNNLVDNNISAYDDNNASNDWHHPVLLEGNYWSDYTGVDDGSGTGKHAIAGDGIGDTNVPHPGTNYDDYPFMSESLWNTTNVSLGTATHTGTANLSASTGYLSNGSAVNESSLPSAGKPDASFPHGLFSFTIAGLKEGDNVTVTIELPDNLSSTSQYWKYGPNGSTNNPQPARWYNLPVGSNDGDTIITIQLTDGGVGDDDGIANGVIFDQGGPVLVPDLTLNSSNITFSPTSPTEGDSVTITALVQNIGDANASDFTVSFFDGASLIGNDTISVNVTSPSNASITWTAVAGDHSIRVVADSEDVIVESDEENNEAARTITVLKMPPAITYGGGGRRAPPINVPVDPATGAVTSNTTLTVDGATLIIPEGTVIKDAEGNPLSTSIIMLSTATTAGRVGAILAFEFSPGGITFEPPIDLVIAYDPADLPEGVSESDLVIRMWDGTAWVDLETTIDTAVHTATAKVSHFTLFALFAAPPVAPPPTPTPVVTPTPPPAVTPTPVPTPPPPFPVVPLVVIIAIVIIVIIVAVAYVVLRRRP